MQLKRIKIENIRSIKKEEIDLPPSIILFYGDIGSGKSSVLKAIEFALFGALTAADLKADSILRRGENKATVELEFSIDGNEYIIKRMLSKSKKGSISQKSGILTINGEMTTYATTDLKRKILEILNYSVARYERAQKIPIFRYTVYTPQENIKEILEAKPEDRFEILKYIFGIEKYEIAKANIETIGSYLREKFKEVDSKLKDYSNIESEIQNKEMEYKVQEKKLSKFNTQLEKKSKEVTEQKKSINNLEGESEELEQKIREIDKKESLLQQEKDNKEKNENKVSTNQNSIIKFKEELNKIPEIKLNFTESQDELSKKIDDIKNKRIEKEKQRAILEKSISDINKLLREGRCSLCGQTIHEQERFNKELKETQESIDSLSNQIEEFNKEIDLLENNLKLSKQYSETRASRESYEKLIELAKKMEKGLLDEIANFEQNIENYQKEIKKVLEKYKIKDLESFSKLTIDKKEKIKELRKALEGLQKEESDLNAKVSVEKKSLEYIKNELEVLKKHLEYKKLLQEKMDKLSSLKGWINENFPVLLGDIEREIVSSSAVQFNDYFKKWFYLLVEENNIEVEIRPDDFEPIIYVDGYESPFGDMSGGEKSALALAYRLALNRIINERYQEVKTKDILILDEPTDGFSEQQINKMQYLFDSLNTEQIIVISHDRALDSFVTDIFNFRKTNHITKITKES